MKTSAILVGSSAALAAAQATFPAGFPECGQVCITNMLNLANNFGCGLDPVCLCTRPDFLYGIRDCSHEYCRDPDAATRSINYGTQYCADAGIAVSGLAGNTASATVSASTTVLATATTTGPATGAGSTGPDGVTTGIPVATDEILSTFTESGSVVTSTVGSTTVFSTLEPSITGTSSSGSVDTTTETEVVTTTTESGSDTSSSGSVVSTTTETEVVTTTSGSATESESSTVSLVVSSTVSSVVSSTVEAISSDVTITTTNAEGQTQTTVVPTTVPASEEDGADETTDPGNLAAQHTAGPVAIMAAAGMAAALLL
ncbi:hypothetical protein DL764_003674 [Monosporascus ibericus]|uniref:CFEM domain-containing protein n=1 Tax=Monosporascus ibericus TaxID=155417 RepID=A0A4Q4TK14_9PEZI|nr:hypothetical protein DL764_003674 [Monosporascus ibericus]